MHAVAFPAPSVSVIHPAPQTAHATVDALLYCPAAHAVQFVPPPCAKVSVIDPAPHSTQDDCPPKPWYCPAAHGAHAVVDTLLYCPAAHITHDVPAGAAKVSVTEPAGHTAHATVDTLLY